jgi:four helix bundle protein
MRRSAVGGQRSDVGDPRTDVGSQYLEKGETVRINSAKDLDIYRKAYALSMDIFRLSKSWPSDEKYSLADQIRRSSRSVCSNLREAWAKRRYEAHFVSKLSDCDGENSETDTWLDYARDCGYIDADCHDKLTDEVKQVGRMLGSMKPFLLTSDI